VKKKKKCETATESLHLHLQQTSTLGDSTDVLAALKAKMEKTEKNNFLIFLKYKSRSNVGLFFTSILCALSCYSLQSFT
jgi:hypothetical protein